VLTVLLVFHADFAGEHATDLTTQNAEGTEDYCGGAAGAAVSPPP
jgi:hypothetical protein